MSYGLRLRLLAASAACLLCAAGTRAAQPDYPVVPGFERVFAADKADSADGGRPPLGRPNCVMCPRTDDPAVSRKQAPVLDHLAARVRVSYLKAFLADPQAVKPGTAMPNVFAVDPDRAAKVEALVQFLASTG